MDWHQRYVQQARWTRELRSYLFRKAGLDAASRVLEVGCGTGAILAGLPAGISPHGLDIDPAALAQCRSHAPSATLTRGNALRLPCANGKFDLAYCHFLLLWVDDPLRALLEMKRVTEPGGHVIAFAEPDYSARIDEPPELKQLGQWQMESLRRQGADPALGARLTDLFFRAGIRLVETGSIQNASQDPAPEEWEMEWAVIQSDLDGWVPAAELQRMKGLDREARLQGKRVLHVPTFFAWGQV